MPTSNIYRGRASIAWQSLGSLPSSPRPAELSFPPQNRVRVDGRSHNPRNSDQVVVHPSTALAAGRAAPAPAPQQQQQLVAMQARAYPAYRLPASGPLAGAGHSSCFPRGGTVARRTPAGRGGATGVHAVDGASAAAAVAAAADAPLPPSQVTWQIVVGTVAGVTPFVVAGIEFGKRIIAQKKCEVCGGSGLVPKNDYYVRCQGCGGFLPWQSWRRFFTG